MYAIVKKTYLVPKPPPTSEAKPSTVAGQVKFERLSPSQNPQELPDWTADTPIYKAAVAEGSIIEVVLKNKPVAASSDLSKARELGFVPAEEAKEEEAAAGAKKKTRKAKG